ncbi:MAG: hypothetical protein WA816_03900 [Bacteroidales bacterium]
MKTMTLLMFSLFLISGSLMGQKAKFNFIDSDIKKEFFQLRMLDTPRLSKPDIKIPEKPEFPIRDNINRFNLYPDSSFNDFFSNRHNSDFVVVEEYPGTSGYNEDPFIIKPDSNGELLIIKPDLSVKYHLIILDPSRYTIAK